MKKIKTNIALVAGSLAVAGTSNANTQLMTVDDLAKGGFNTDIIQQEFLRNYHIELKAADILKVSLDDEGKNFNFETLDCYSTVVIRAASAGVGNKDKFSN